MHMGRCPRRHQQLRMPLQFPCQIFSTKNKQAGQPTSSNNNNQQVHPSKTTMQWHLGCWRRPPAHQNTHVNTIFSMLNCDWNLERGQSVPPGKRSPPHAPACHVKGVPPSAGELSQCSQALKCQLFHCCNPSLVSFRRSWCHPNLLLFCSWHLRVFV